MPRRKQEQPKRLPSHVDSVEEGGPDGGCCPVEDDGGVGGGGWYGNASDTRSESSYSGDIHDDHELFLHGGSPPTPSPDRPPEHPDTSTESSLGGCPTPVHNHHRASLELLSLGVDGGVFSAQDTLSSVVSSLYGEAASEALGKPLSSNLRRLLEAGSLKLDGELLGRVRGGGGESPPIGLAPALTLSPSSHHAQQLSALARKLAANNNNNNSGGSASASPASVTMSTTAIKQEPCDPFASVAAPSNGAGFVWVGVAGDGKWPPAGCSASSGGSSLSPDSAIQKLKAAANAVLQDKNATVVASSTSSSSSSCSTIPTLGGGSRGGTDDSVRFDAFTSPFSPQSASSTLAALSKKVSERSQTTSTPSSSDHQHQPSTGSSFLSLVSMTSSAALLKEVAARAAGNLLADKMEATAGGGAIQEDIKPLLDRNQKAGTPTGPQSAMDLLLPSTPKGRAKPSSQAGSPGEDGGKPFQCPVCGLVIKRKSYWKRHMVIHTGLKSHQCPLCPFRCARKDNLKSHMKHQDRGETFQCELCPFTSSRHFSLKLHMRCHQHFPRSGSASDGVKVKEEATTDTEGEGSLLGDFNPGESPLQSDAGNQSSPGVSNHHVYIKEEPQERELSVLSPFTLCRDRERERPGSSGNSLDLSMGGVGLGVGVRSSPGGGPTAASLFSPDITTKTATDLLMKLSAANQKEALKAPQSFHLKQEPRAEEDEEEVRRSPRSQPSYSSFYQEQGVALGATGPAEVTTDSGDHRGTLKGREGSPMGNKNSLLSQDINFKVASELLMKLSESNKDAAHYQKVTVKAEPMEVDPASGPAPPPTHLLAFSTLGVCEKSEPMTSLPEALSRPQKQDLFSQDISVKMASELLFQLSEKVSKANDHKDGNMVGISSPFMDERFRQSPFSQRSKSSSPAEASSSARTALHDPEKDTGEPGGTGCPRGY
ncbi:zinc finger protein 827-like isoform X2 [Oncorhynchus keta]|uniref:zinc finger protein 827-like isoform X2 n=1 Tax=Oncorhynchus keta TaxID=8018 RepID=UPI00227CDF7E|nr:zinc finger protein 827-like isoform X2 [Oncorhynchus keta]